jgi:hypothetical protein
VMHGKHSLGASQKIIDQSGPVVIAGLTMQLSATLYRILKGMQETDMEQTANFQGTVAKPSNAYLNADEHWLTNARPRAGHTSPVMTFKGKTMMIADVLLNLAYPSGRLYTFGLRRRCDNNACVNPGHYIYGWNPKDTQYKSIEEAGIGYHMATAPIPQSYQKPLPKYMLDMETFRPCYSHSWKDYLNAAEDYWTGEAEKLSQGKEKGLPTSAEGVLALLGGKKEKDLSGPQLGDLFRAMGGKWGRE